MANSPAVWYIGHHERKRSAPVNEQSLREAQDANYDMLTTPITTPHFQSNVHAILSTYYSSLDHGTHASPVPAPLIPPLKPADTTFEPHESIGQLLALTSDWIDLASHDPGIADISRQIFNLELKYAAFCGIQTVIVQGPRVNGTSHTSAGLAQYARAIHEALNVGGYLHLHILLPLCRDIDNIGVEPAHLSNFERSTSIPDDAIINGDTTEHWRPWDSWNFIRTFCKFNARLSVAMSLSARLPPPAVLTRWFSEPLRIILIPGSTFKLNSYEQPVLPRAHQAVLAKYMQLRNTPWLLLGDVGPIPRPGSTPYSASTVVDTSEDIFPTLAEAATINEMTQRKIRKVRNDPTPHLNYLRRLQREEPQKTAFEGFSSGYQDFLQSPLQPLADNLESVTYEVFEKDPIKYDWYERAIMHALIDWSSQGKSVSSTSGAVVVAVVGAGRGPLVTRALRAGQLAQVKIEVWAIEKNLNAFVLLQRNNETIWNQQVTVVKTDMRHWNGPLKDDGSYGHVDIFVSELLGSFADNELSPECLDGVQHVLNPTHGISIPASYTAHLTPIAAPKIHSDLLGKSILKDDAFEMPWVVMLHSFDFLSTEVAHSMPVDDKSYRASQVFTQDNPGFARKPVVKTCWRFDHPQPAAILEQAQLRRSGGAAGGGGGQSGGDGANEHNTRFCSLTFHCANRGICHGLAGYFETVLYTPVASPGPGGAQSEAIELSTNPLTMDAKSKDMISWFPIFFPLRTPLVFPDNSRLQVSMWRCTDDRKVWYEWVVEAFAVIDGEMVRVGMSDLHSSKKHGCLM